MAEIKTQFLYFIILASYFTLECLCVFQSNPPEHVASTPGHSDSFQPGASFSVTVGGKQSDTQESSSDARVLKTDNMTDSKQNQTHLQS